MMSPRKSSSGRRGLSLLEVLVALAVFLLAFVSLGRLVTLSGDQAFEAQQQYRAADLCQTKLAEVIAGAVSLTSVSEVPFEEDPSWRWSLDCERSYPGLWNVTIRVSKQQGQTRDFCSLTQMVLDPQIHGNVQDTPPDNGASSGRSSRSSGTTGSAGGGN